MSPILVRPVREQLEHDRVIRLLQVRWKRRYQVAVNPGAEHNVAVGPAEAPLYPDLVLTPHGRKRRPEAIVEVETAESINGLEAMAEWARMAHERAALYLVVPIGGVDATRRLCAENSVNVAEIWSYYTFGDEIRFAPVYRAPATPAQARRAARDAKRAARPKAGARPARKAARPAAPSKARKAAKHGRSNARRPAARKPGKKAAKTTRHR